MNSIIDRDIEFYTGMAEQHRVDLCRCVPSEESSHRERMIRAVAAYQALLRYKATLPVGVAK
jgi:hypothetical protein